jgi:RND family efflux transporter MFP subunit
MRPPGRRVTAAAVIWLGLALAAAADGPPLPVQIVTVRHTADHRSFTLTGEVAARHVLTASFPDSGRIVALPVSEGDHVAKGAVLARLDSVQQEQALLSAKAALSTAEASAKKAREDANRQDGLLERGATTRSARDAAADTLRAAEAGVAQARADLDRAQKALADTVLRAPAAATVTDKMAELGQVVGAAQPVLQLALGDRYDAIFQVPEAVPATLAASPVAVTLAPVGRPKDAVIGRPRLISPLIDPAQGTVKVTVSMPRLPEGMHIGDPVVGTISVEEPPRVMLPWSAITATEKGPAVWVVNPKTHVVALKQVKILRYETGRIILSGGLKDGEEVVGMGANLLYPGRVVRRAEGE